MTAGDALAAADAALAAGRWEDARIAYEAAVAGGESAEARFGLASTSWWLGDNIRSITECRRAYALFRRRGDVGHAVQCALWLAITYKANFANVAAASGWIGRAERLLQTVQPGPLHGYAWVARAYRMADLEQAEGLTRQAIAVARRGDDVDLELEALSQLGLIRVGRGDTAGGLAMIDEAMAAALGGEHTRLDTVVYTCCDMLNACELASDIERAAQWCQAADEFVSTYGCPFLYAECRIFYGSVLTAKGRWAEAEHELDTGLRITEGACPALHDRALIRLAGLRVRQGRLEDAERLLADVGRSVEADAEAALSRAALLLARGDSAGASRLLSRRMQDLAAHRLHRCSALDVLVDASLASGDLETAASAAGRLAQTAGEASSEHLDALARRAAGRVAMATGEGRRAIAELEAALAMWIDIDLPYEVARTRFELGRALAAVERDAGVDHARRALGAFEELGAPVDADRVAAHLRALGVVARTGAKGAGVLTEREQQVLRLLGVGLSNPEIAARLHVSRKTAAHHVSSVLSKLHLRNRAEAAAHAVATLGPPAPPR